REARRSLKGAVRTHSARRARGRSAATFVGVTGSSGKTTTVALLSHILSARARTKTQVNSNSLNATWETLSDLGDAEYVVMEIGTSRPGNIPALAGMARPHVAVVTMVGLEHYTAFRSKEAVAAEKGALVACLPPDGFALLNNDDPNVAGMAGLTRARVV